MDAAYQRACEEGSKEVFLARLNLVGFHEAGKTSLAKRLMGKDFDANVKSTEGVSVHYIKSNFNKSSADGEDWNESKQNTNELNKLFVDEMRKYLPSSSDTEQHSSKLKTGHVPEKINIPKKVETNISVKKAQQSKRAEEPKKPNVESKGTIVFQAKKVTPESGLPDKNKVPPIDEKSGTNVEMSEKFKRFALTQIDLPTREVSKEIVPFILRLWDLGGQNDFINTHHLFLDTMATTLIVMDITKELHSEFDGEIKCGNPKNPAEVLCYWLNSFHIQHVSGGLKPNIVLVLTHIDMVEAKQRYQFIQNYKEKILETLEGKPYSYLITPGSIYAVDNRSTDDVDFQLLRKQLLQYFTQQASWGKKIPTKWLKLEADILENKKWIHLDHVKKMAVLVGMKSEEVESFLHMHNNLGNFIHFGDQQLKHIVITDPQWLVDMCKAVITHYDFLEERKISAAAADQLKNGFVNSQCLSELWNGEDIKFLTDLMIKFNFFLLVEGSERYDKKYFIPCMLPSYNMYEAEHYKNMVCLFSASHTVEMGDQLSVGTFHKIISVCSNKAKWTLTTKCPLSYTDASLITRDGLRVEMSLQSHPTIKASKTEIRTNFWCEQDALVNNLTLAVLQTKQLLNQNMRLMNIAPTKHFLVLCPNYNPSDECLLCMVEVVEKYHNWISLCEDQNPCPCHKKPIESIGYAWQIHSLYSKSILNQISESPSSAVIAQFTECVPARSHNTTDSMVGHGFEFHQCLLAGMFQKVAWLQVSSFCTKGESHQMCNMYSSSKYT